MDAMLRNGFDDMETLADMKEAMRINRGWSIRKLAGASGSTWAKTHFLGSGSVVENLALQQAPFPFQLFHT